MHIFPYSKRNGTVAEKFKNVKLLLKENVALREEIEQKTREFYGINLKKK